MFSAESVEQCITNLMQSPYTGTVSTTNHGFTCMDWTMIYGSHENNVYDDYFPADGGVIGAKNYCRTYGSYRKPYCFIDNPYITYGYCNLRICNGKSNHVNDITYLSETVHKTTRSALGVGQHIKNNLIVDKTQFHLLSIPLEFVNHRLSQLFI